MGCVTSSSSKVGPVPPITSATTKSTPAPSINGKRENFIRGDRLSLADAKQKRESESRKRIRRLSSLATGEVEKARKNSASQLSISPSSEFNQQNDPTGQKINNTKQKDDIFKTQVLPLQNQFKNTEITVTPSSDTESDIEIDLNQYISKGKNNDSDSSDISEHSINQQNKSDYSISNKPSDNTVIQNHANNFINDVIYKATQQFNTQNNVGNATHSNDTLYCIDSQVQNDNQSKTPNKIISVQSFQTQSIDSLDLRNNANILVHDILSQAAAEMKNGQSKSVSPYNNTASMDCRSKDSTSRSHSAAENEAKQLVGSVLNNAIYELSSIDR